MNTTYKRKYHPLIIILYNFGVLTENQLQDIPKKTRERWNKFNHEDYDLHEWSKEYIEQFDQIKKVLIKKHNHSALKSLIALSSGYSEIMNNINNGKKLMRENANKLIASVDWMAKHTKLSLKTAIKLFKIDRSWYYRHHPDKGCKNSALNLCFKQMPGQLTFEEVSVIDNTVNDEKQIWKTKASLYYELLRKGVLICAISTFYKYAAILRTIKKPVIPKHKPTTVAATYCFEWLHVDITYIKTENGSVQKVAFVKDNYSKAILHHKSTSEKAGSDFIQELLKETFDKYGLLERSKDINILSDGGSENKGAVLEWLDTLVAPPIIRKITANTIDFPYSNNMSESTHRIYKTEFMQGKLSLNEDAHIKDIERFIEYYNYQRLPMRLYGLTPMEVINGATIDKHRFQEQIQNARKQRIIANRNYNGCTVF